MNPFAYGQLSDHFRRVDFTDGPLFQDGLQREIQYTTVGEWNGGVAPYYWPQAEGVGQHFCVADMTQFLSAGLASTVQGIFHAGEKPWPLEKTWESVTRAAEQGIIIRWHNQDNHIRVCAFRHDEFPTVVGIKVTEVADGVIASETTYINDVPEPPDPPWLSTFLEVSNINDEITLRWRDQILGVHETVVHRNAPGIGFYAFGHPTTFMMFLMGTTLGQPNHESSRLVVTSPVPQCPPPPPTAESTGQIVTSVLARGRLLIETDGQRQRTPVVRVGPFLGPTLRGVGVLQPIAGATDGAYGQLDGTGTNARFNLPMDVTLDEDETVLYVADYGNAAIRRIQLDEARPGVVDTFASTANLPLYIANPRGPDPPPGGPVSDRPRHLDHSGTRLTFTGDTTVGDVNTETGYAQAVAVVPNGTIGAISGSLVKYPLNQFVSGWRTVVFDIPPKVPEPKEPPPQRGNYWEEPDSPSNPVVPYCGDEGTEMPAVHWFRDGAYADDGGITRISTSFIAYRMRHATLPLVVRNYIWPHYSGWGIPAPFHHCHDGVVHEPPFGAGPVVTDTTFQPSPRQIAMGPWNLTANLPTVVGPTSGLAGPIQKVTVQPDLVAFSVTYDYDHSRGLQRVPARSVVYAHTRGIYYLALGHLLNSATIHYTHYPNRIVALDLYAPDPAVAVTTATRAVSDISPPKPITLTFTPASIRLGRNLAPAGSGRFPIGMQPPVPYGIVDEHGSVLVDDDGNGLVFD